MAYQPLLLFNAKAILLEKQQWYYLTNSEEDTGVHTFPKGIWPKVNVIAFVMNGPYPITVRKQMIIILK